METILCFADPHYPYQHQDLIPFLQALINQFNPNRIICLGDLIDAHALSSYQKEAKSCRARQEWLDTKKELKPLIKLIPELEITLGNHTMRHLKRAQEIDIPEEYFKSLNDIFELPNTWIFTDEIWIENTKFFHGEGFNGRYSAHHMLNTLSCNIVHGHLHSNAGINYRDNGIDVRWVLSCGCLVDTKSFAFTYGKNCKDKPLLGAALIINGVPMFFPMKLNNKGRWIGHL